MPGQPVLEGWPPPGVPLVSRGIQWSLPWVCRFLSRADDCGHFKPQRIGGGLLCSNRRFAKPDCQQSLSAPPSKYTHNPITTLPTQLPVLTVRFQQPPSRYPLPCLTTGSCEDSSQILSLCSAFGSFPYTRARRLECVTLTRSFLWPDASQPSFPYPLSAPLPVSPGPSKLSHAQGCYCWLSRSKLLCFFHPKSIKSAWKDLLAALFPAPRSDVLFSAAFRFIVILSLI